MDSNKSASASGLQTVFDTILVPATAFERLRTAPTWGWALVISIVVYAAASFVITPAIIHGFQSMWPAMVASDPRMAAMTPEEQQRGLAITVAVMQYSWLISIVIVPLVVLVTTIVMLIFNAIGRGSATFASLWAAAANIGVPIMAIGGIVLAIIVMLRGAASFNSTLAVTTALPSLAWIVPGAGPKLTAFLGTFTIFQIWGMVLLYLAMRITARVGTVPAVLAALIVPVVGALFAMAGAR
jgi:hypothetical protein